MVKKRKKNKAKESIEQYKKEFNKQLTTAVTAGIAFLVALTWREPIADTINMLISYLNITTGELLFKYISAFLFTIIAVIPLIIVSRLKKNE